MSNYAWYRSLYWRIAIGFIALLAALLLAQGLLFLWLTNRIDQSPAGRTPQQLADYVARQLSDALADVPDLDVGAYVRDEFSSLTRPFAIVMADGRRFSNRPDALPSGFPNLGPRGGRGGGRGSRFGGPGRGGGEREQQAPAAPPGPSRADTPDGPRPGRRGGPNSAPIVVGGQQVGIVAVPPSPAALVALSEYGPALAGTALLLLVLGTAVAAFAIFGPTHRRLRSLGLAARALGEGRPGVRADDAGGDEVAELAGTFNRMAADLNQRAAALEAADRARRQLLADVSHELMTPLTAIRGYIQTLSMPDLEIDADTRARYLSIADQETYKLEAIIGELLDLARIEGGGDRRADDQVAVDDLFRRIVDRHLPEIRANDITVQVSVDPATPPLRGNPARLEQALQNLAANAVRHMPEGGTLGLSADADHGQVRIVVRDTGPGIPPEHLPHVFERFYKADAARAGSKIRAGSGLGLSIVRAIVRHHGGEVHAANREGGGAEFTLCLPAAGPSGAGAASTPQS